MQKSILAKVYVHIQYIQRKGSFDQRTGRLFTQLAGEFLGTWDGVGLSCSDVINTFFRHMGKRWKLLTFVSVIGDARIRALVSTRERNEASGFGTSTTSDFELVAAWVELSTRVLVCSMQC